MYAMVLTRSDISHALSVVSRFMSNPGIDHWRTVKWIMRYLRGTTEYGLLYGGSGNEGNILVGYIDMTFVYLRGMYSQLESYIIEYSGFVNYRS